MAIKFGFKAFSVLASGVFALAIVSGCTEEAAPPAAAPAAAPGASAPAKPAMEKPAAPAPVPAPKEEPKK